MKTYKRLIVLLLTLCLMLSFSTAAFAEDYSGDDVYPGLSGIQPGDTLTLPDNTIWATLTASWGVRVTFLDWNEKQLKTELVPVTDTTPGVSSAPADPTREGYVFVGWERCDTNDGPATLNDDGTVTGVNGPGPIVFIAKYKGVLADGQTAGNVTVINTTHEHEYVGYKILDAEVSPSDTSAIIYTITEDSPWYEYVQEYFDLTERREDENGKTVYQADPKDGFDPKTFVDGLPKEDIAPDLTKQTPNRDGIITWENVPFGYYAITSTLGSWVSVNTNNPNAKLIDKNQTAVLDKNIIENGEKTKVNSASFGESVDFDIEVFGGDYNANELVTYYHVTDELGSGFDYDFTDNKNVTVSVTGTQNGTNGEDPYEFTLSPVSSLEALGTAESGYYFAYTAGSRTFEIIVKWAALNDDGELAPVYEDEFNYLHVTYSATVNDSAVIAGDGNPNTASLSYDKTSGYDPEDLPKEEPTPGENNEDPDNPVSTATYVYALGIEKVDAEDNTKHLPGVKFTTEDFRTKMVSDGVYEAIGENDTTSTAAEYFEVPESGFIVIKGLGAGEYSFTETETLPGYNRLAETLEMTISVSAETVATINETPCAAFSQVKNSTGTELPSTGGIGTTLFITLGMIAMLGAGVFLVTNKRISKEEI